MRIEEEDWRGRYWDASVPGERRMTLAQRGHPTDDEVLVRYLVVRRHLRKPPGCVGELWWSWSYQPWPDDARSATAEAGHFDHWQEAADAAAAWWMTDPAAIALG